MLLHGRVLPYPFISDDYIFLHETRGGGLGNLFAAVSIGQNYYRPIGREVYFYLGHLLLDTNPFAFRVLNLGLLVAITGMVMGLAWRLAGPRAGVLAGALYALLYPHRVLLTWISCSQDILAAAIALLAAHLWLSGRRWPAAGAYFVALFAKESAAPLPVILALYEAWSLRLPAAGGARATSLPAAARRAVARTAPLWGATALWVVVVVVVRIARNAWVHAGEALPVADVVLDPGSMLEGYRLSFLSYLGLDQPWPALGDALRRAAVPWAACAVAALLAGVAWLARRRDGAARGGGIVRPPLAPALALGAIWMVVGGLPIALVGHHFSAYYISFSAAGFALLAGALLARLPAVVPAALLAVFAWGNAVANATDTFKFYAEQPTLRGVSYVTFARLDWEARYLRGLKGALDAHPPGRGGRIYLSHAPRYLGLATAGDRAPQVWFDDPDLELTYITHYHPERAAGRPVVLRFDERQWRFVVLPDSLVDAMVYGEEAMSAGEPARARPWLERALAHAVPGEHDVERAELSNTLGVAASLTGDTLAARQAWQQALEIDPGHREANLNLAALEARKGHFAGARAVLRAYLDRAPGDAEALLYLVRVEDALGAGDEARRLWERLAAAHPAFADSVMRGAGR